MIRIERLYCGSVKETAIFFATFVLIYSLTTLMLMDFNDESYFLHSEYIEDPARSVVFYSIAVSFILAIPATISYLYGVIKEKPFFMIPILLLLPFCPLLRIIHIVICWFNWEALVRLFISLMIIPYAWVGFFKHYQDTRREKNKNLWVM